MGMEGLPACCPWGTNAGVVEAEGELDVGRTAIQYYLHMRPSCTSRHPPPCGCGAFGATQIKRKSEVLGSEKSEASLRGRPGKTIAKMPAGEHPCR